MKLPNHEQALVPQQKITGYLLSFTHHDGRSKAAFFTRFGFSVAAWEQFVVWFIDAGQTFPRLVTAYPPRGGGG